MTFFFFSPPQIEYYSQRRNLLHLQQQAGNVLLICSITSVRSVLVSWGGTNKSSADMTTKRAMNLATTTKEKVNNILQSILIQTSI